MADVTRLEKELKAVLLISSKLSLVTFGCIREGHLFTVAREKIVLPAIDACPHCKVVVMARDADELRL